MRASQGVGTQEEFSLDPFENDIGGERPSTHAIFVRPRMRADECSGAFFRLRTVQGEATATLVHAPNTASRLVSRP